MTYDEAQKELEKILQEDEDLYFTVKENGFSNLVAVVDMEGFIYASVGVEDTYNIATNWALYRELSEATQSNLYYILCRLAKTPIEERGELS